MNELTFTSVLLVVATQRKMQTMQLFLRQWRQQKYDVRRRSRLFPLEVKVILPHCGKKTFLQHVLKVSKAKELVLE